jgi:hypothetical protein
MIFDMKGFRVCLKGAEQFLKQPLFQATVAGLVLSGIPTYGKAKTNTKVGIGKP